MDAKIHIPAHPPSPAASTLSVSIVDDDDAVRSAIGLLALSMGWQSRSFASAAEFLESGAVDSTDCLILDLRMPGMNGAELLEELARRSRHIPTVVVTAQYSDPLVGRALRAGAASILTKPFRDDLLRQFVEETIAPAPSH